MDISNFGLLMTAVDTHILAMFVLVLVKGSSTIMKAYREYAGGGGLGTQYVFFSSKIYIYV